MDLETLGYFLYMDSMEKKQEQEEMLRDIFGESDDSEDEDNE